jgi:hypothetical protein
MTTRRRLPQRRKSDNISFEHGAKHYVATFGHFENGSVGEIFLNCTKTGSEADINASDAAVAVSIALQYGAPLKVLRSSMRRNVDGSPQGPIAAALDRIRDE